MTNRTGDDKIEKIMDDFDSTVDLPDENQNGSETSDNTEELSKEEIADRFDIRFAKSPNGGTQHLMPSEDDTIFCRTSLTDDFIASENPGPFDPICTRCRKNVTGGTQTSDLGNTVADYRRWLANEIDGVKQPNGEGTSAVALRKAEMAAVVSHIQSLKQNQ
jgi:hypothetical protein